jgi:hypothetical protein
MAKQSGGSLIRKTVSRQQTVNQRTISNIIEHKNSAWKSPRGNQISAQVGLANNEIKKMAF